MCRLGERLVMDNHEQDDYTFILRLWRERPATAERPAAWRFVLTDARSRERRLFGSIEGVMAFLRETMKGENQNTDGSRL